MANRPDMKAASTPAIVVPMEISPIPNLSTLLNSNTAAPKIAGYFRGDCYYVQFSLGYDACGHYIFRRTNYNDQNSRCGSGCSRNNADYVVWSPF